MPGQENRTFSLASRMNHLALFLNVQVENRVLRFPLENREMEKLFNKFDTPCQSELEFVNHFVAASKSRSLFGIA
jgi:hypothetical protein